MALAENLHDALQALNSGSLIQVRDVLSRLEKISGQKQFPKFCIGIARTFTVEVMLDHLRLALHTLSISPEIVLEDLDQVEQSLLDEGSQLNSSKVDAVLVLWRLEDLHPRLTASADQMSYEERKFALDSLLDRLKEVITGYRGSAPLFLCTLPVPSIWRNQLHDVHRAYGIKEIVARFNVELFTYAGEKKVYVFDLSSWTESVGREVHNPKFEFLARQPYLPKFHGSLAIAVSDAIRPMLIPPAKVLALDLDNTLWGGVVGEDGPGGLRIGQDSDGVVYWRIQEAIARLKHRGTILVLLSKNNADDVESAFRSFPEMPLRISDFTLVRANWRNKHENLREVAEILNLGLESFAFLDDQAFEREQMAYALPAVKVLDVTSDPLSIFIALRDSRLFDSYRVSDEDLGRAKEYKAQALRSAIESSSSNKAEFLKSLQLAAKVENVSEVTIQRVVQLLAKTNQFNLTTRRHGEAVVRRWANDSKNVVLSFTLGDKFGDQGIIGLVIAIPHGKDALHVDSFLLSCRALGRGAELVMWAALVNQALLKGYSEITAEFIPSNKNVQVTDLLSQLGMSRTSATNDQNIYRFKIAGHIAMPDWINVNLGEINE